MAPRFKLFIYSLLAICMLVTGAVSSKQSVIKIPAPRSNFDVSHDYHLQLIKLALNTTSVSYKIENIELPLTQGRAQVELEKGELINLYWLGSELALDEILTPVPIPTTRGLIGFRKLFIRTELQADFAKVSSIEQLRNFIACQGQHWPDTKILQNADLPVTSSANYETLFYMLEIGRCDYFPRGIHDYLTELDLRSARHNKLSQQDSIQLYYPFAVYFYTNKQQPELAKQLTDGMSKLAENGELLQFMQRHELTKHVFTSKKSNSKTIIKLDNNTMTPNHRITDPDYWFQPDDFLAR